MRDQDRDTYVAFHTVSDPDTWADREGQFVHDGMYFRKVRLVSPPHPTECALQATLWAARDGEMDKALSSEDKDRVIHAMIKHLDGVQDHATGTVVFDIPLDIEGIDAQLWVHEWE